MRATPKMSARWCEHVHYAADLRYDTGAMTQVPVQAPPLTSFLAGGL